MTTRFDALKVEYEQQYQQYRWIGTQQALVFTFYAAIIAATFSLIGSFSKGDLLGQFQPWSVAILFLLGTVGLIVSFSLIQSRAMQFRTILYILELLIQMNDEATTPSMSPPAFRFKVLPTTGGRFLPSDTVIIAISLVFLFAIALLFGAVTLFLMSTFNFDQLYSTIYWLIAVMVVGSLGIFYFLPKILEQEKESARNDHKQAKDIENWADEIRKQFILK